MTSFLGEIKRRKVFQVAGVYLVVAWLIVQVVDVVNDPLNLPDWFDTVAIIFLAIGFPISLVLSWAFELTPDGMVRDRGSPLQTHSGGRKIEYLLFGLLTIAVGWILYRTEFSTPDKTAELVAEETERQPLPNSVAVLICDNLSPDPEDAYFAAGIHDEILNQLTNIGALDVIARTSVLRYVDQPRPISEIAEELNVETVMECSVRYAGDDILVTAQLIDPETNSHLWSKTYPGSVGDLSAVFAMQADIARNIANALEAELTPEEQRRIGLESTDSRDAFELFLKSRDWNLSWESRLRYLDEAIEIDNDFARAYAHRAYTHSLRLGAAEGEEALALQDQILRDAVRALDLDRRLGFAHIAIAWVHLNNDRNEDAAAEFERAIALSPNSTYVLDRAAVFHYIAGNWTRAVEFAERAVELDPGNAELHDGLADALLLAGRLDDAAAAYRRTTQLDRRNPDPYLRLAFIELARGDDAEALSQLRLCEYTSDDQREVWAGTLAALAYGYERLGRHGDAQRAATKARARIDEGSFVDGGHLALLLSVEGSLDAALGQIENAFESSHLDPFVRFYFLDDPELTQSQ